MADYMDIKTTEKSESEWLKAIDVVGTIGIAAFFATAMIMDILDNESINPDIGLNEAAPVHETISAPPSVAPDNVMMFFPTPTF